MDWREMEAGRELDRLIAEKMGSETKVTETPNGLLVERLVHSGAFDMGAHYERVPHYSTSVDAALTLIPDQGLMVTMNRGNGPYSNVGNRWVCHMQTMSGFDVTIFDDSPALAICRAWLEWQEFQGNH